MDWYLIFAIVLGALAALLAVSAAFYKQFFKRFYDILLSALALIALSPVILFLIIAGSVAMKGNPFFTQLRPGKISKKNSKEKIFKLIKLRTMTCEKDENGNLLPDEKRLTSYGRFLRSTSLDELPELINIFKGDMSIIGPRPQLVRDMVFMTERQRFRHSVRPGLSGLAQVNGRNNISWEEKFEYDLQYIQEGITLFGDVKIIIETILKVLKRSDTVREGTQSDIDFGDWLLENQKISRADYDAKMEQAKKIISEI